MARDDPAFVVLQLAFLLASSVSFTIAYHSFSPAKIVSTIFYTILVDWLLVGVVVSTVCWTLANFYLTKEQSRNPRLDWFFAFDTHCNAFFPLFILLYVVQYFAAPILLQPNLVSCIAANIMYTIAFTAYYYIIFISYSEIRFLSHTEVFLYPIGLSILVFFVCSLLRINLTRSFLSYYFL
eukprot:c8612_g1_i1.p1 GENE.c8612_g1_i1~~c8612_g1_i1.p1  ORF type:complete len:181 (-),score=36.46 c8612_g1_i1:107-649(-)